MENANNQNTKAIVVLVIIIIALTLTGLIVTNYQLPNEDAQVSKANSIPVIDSTNNAKTVTHMESSNSNGYLHTEVQVTGGIDGDIGIALGNQYHNVTVFFEVAYQNGSSSTQTYYTEPHEYEVWDKDTKFRARDNAKKIFRYKHRYDDEIVDINCYTYPSYSEASQHYEQLSGN